jgi:hypothetical protein
MTYPPLPAEPTWADLVPGDRLELTNIFNTDIRFTWTIRAEVHPADHKLGQVVVPIHTSTDPTNPKNMPERADRLVTDIGGFEVAVHPSPDRRSA